MSYEATRGETAVGSRSGDFGKVIKAEYEANAEILKRLGLARRTED